MAVCDDFSVKDNFPSVPTKAKKPAYLSVFDITAYKGR